MAEEESDYQHRQLVANDPAAILIKDMIEASGGVKGYRELEDVEYTYIYRNPETGARDISLERYMYDGEKSWARYTEHSNSLMPDTAGIIEQGYNGDTTWMTFRGTPVTDQQLLRRADFLRKTNFYWFNMMYKLLDDGTLLESLPDRTVDSIRYEVIRVSFEKNVGDAQDTYVLYINPETGLVDQFLFTVMDFGRAEPLLMEVEYEEINGLLWPAYRRYTPSDWDGQFPGDAKWTEEISENIKFNNGFEEELFDVPDGQ